MTALSLSQMALTMSRTFLGGCDSTAPSAFWTGRRRQRFDVKVSAKGIASQESSVDKRVNNTDSVVQIWRKRRQNRVDEKGITDGTDTDA